MIMLTGAVFVLLHLPSIVFHLLLLPLLCVEQVSLVHVHFRRNSCPSSCLGLQH